jgi:signal transduction protein with GAF and PtsI domain
MNPQSIPAVKQMIRSISFSETQPLVEEILKINSAEQVFKLLRDTYWDVLPKVDHPR